MDQPTSERIERDEDHIRARVRVSFVLLAAFGLFHAWASWGYAGPLWTRHGWWLHAVERMAAGEQPYRDFHWATPPLGLWIVGGLARFTGSGFPAISVVTITLYLTILALFYLVALRLAREVILPVTIVAMLFATAYAARTGVPLPLGTEAISVPFAVAFLLGSALLADAVVKGRGGAAAACCGALAALSMMSGYQLWFAAMYVVVVVNVMLRRRDRMRDAATVVAGFVVTMLILMVLLGTLSGVGSVAGLLTGFGRAGAMLVEAQPTLERLTIDTAAVSAITLTATVALWLCLAISDRAAGRWAGIALLVFLCAAAVHLGMSVALGTQLSASQDEWPSVLETQLANAMLSGRSLIPTAFAVLDERFTAHLFPVMLPAFLLVVLFVRWKRWNSPPLRNLIAVLLGLCLVSRAYHGFQGSEWYNVLFEIPTYVLMLRLGGAAAIHQAGRAVLAALGVMVMLGFYAYASAARGPLTFRGTWQPILTARGMVRWPAAEARHYAEAEEALNLADPARLRPLLAYGPTAGWNYFLGRKNPTPATEGLYALGTRKADSIVAVLKGMRPAPLYVDHPLLRRSVATGFAPWRWEPRMGPSPYLTISRARFESLIEGCTRVMDRADTTSVVRVFDCEVRAQATR